jgi:RecA-family ATPase
MISTETSRFKLITLEELDDLPEPSWLIKGILPENALGVLFGLPGSMKTFVALSMALSIGAGHDWCGKATKKGSVLYVAAEGLSGLRVRSQAYRQIHWINAAEVRFMGEGLNLCNPDDLRQVRRCIENNNFRPEFIVIDTLARSIPGAEENSSRDMGEVICAVDELRRETSAMALLVHHTGKDGEAERGSSALRGAADVVIKCGIKPSDSHLVSLSCKKMKDAEHSSLQLSNWSGCKLHLQLHRWR